MMENPPLLNGGPVIRIEGTVGSEPVHERDQPPCYDLDLGAGYPRVVPPQQRLDPALSRADVPCFGLGQVRIAHGHAPVTRQQPPLGLALGIERKQRLQAFAKAAALSLSLVEPGAGPLRDDFEGEAKQVALVSEVMREDGGTRSRGLSHIPESQRLQAARPDELGGSSGDVSAASLVVHVSRH
jgi:hypothetical protein